MLMQEERELVVEYGKKMSAARLSTGTSGVICGSSQFRFDTNSATPPISAAKAGARRERRAKTKPESTVAQPT